MQDNGTAIHWHGLRQLNNNEFDGVPGVTQCPIVCLLLSDPVHLDSSCSNMLWHGLVTWSDVHLQMASDSIRLGK